MDVYDELGSPMKCLRSWRQPNSEKKNIRFTKLEIDCQVGMGLTLGQGSDPQLMMRTSNDGGITWSPERFMSLGAIGQYSTQVRYWDCGVARDRVWEISLTDPIPFAVVGGYVDGQVIRG